MGYRYLDHISYADVAFEVEGKTLEELFRRASDALLNVMLVDIESISARTLREVHLRQHMESKEDLAHLLFDFLQGFVYWKDVELLFLRVQSISIKWLAEIQTFELDAVLGGDEIPQREDLMGTDIKGVTYHQLKVWEENHIWKATVVLDT